MSWSTLGVVLVGGLALVIVVVGVARMFLRFYRKVEQGKALIINKTGHDNVVVTFTGGVVWPVFWKAELMDISVKTIEIDRRGKDGLVCQDNIRADIKVTFYVRVNKTQEDVIKVAQAVGCARASDQETLEALFNAKFSEALKTVGKRLDFVDLYTKREEFRDWIIEVIGRDLNGYFLEDAAIDYLEQTPVAMLDEMNILDAQGIRKITELTAIQHVKTNEFRRDEEKKITKEDVETRETILELEKQQADAEARQKREVESIQAREQAETIKVQQEERLRSEQARIQTEEEIAIREQNRLRETEVAERNRMRVVAVEDERVKKARDLEIVDRERATELQRIEKEKAIEHEKREIANVIRERVAVEKTVAEQEEAIKRVRVVEEANRTKEAAIIIAEGAAQEALVKGVKEAEMSELASKFKAKEEITLAEAAREAAERQAQAEIRLAEASKARAAAEGLAAVQVKEADAIATEKHGLAQVRVKEADAGAVEKQGMAEVHVRQAEAEVVRQVGDAEAEALGKRFAAEAEGLRAKAESMNAFSDGTRQHEEFRLAVEKEKELGLEFIEARMKIAAEQAKLISVGLQNARIDIVGGENVFFDKLVNALAMGESVDRFVNKSETLGPIVKEALGGKGRLHERVRGLLEHVGVGDGAPDTFVEVLERVKANVDAEQRDKVNELVEQARRLGLDKVNVK